MVIRPIKLILVIIDTLLLKIRIVCLILKKINSVKDNQKKK